jgi:Spy/CpxP family protein refolding chaperone
MKTFLLSAGLALAAAFVPAQQSSARAAESDPTVEEIQTIRKILELPPERLARMRSAIEKMERMSPESRRDFAANLAKYESASPEERHKIMKEMRERGGFAARVLEHHFKTLTTEEAKVERARIQALTPEQRMDFVRKLAEKYGPEVSKGKAGDGKEGDKAAMKRRKQAEGEAPAAPAAAPKQ